MKIQLDTTIPARFIELGFREEAAFIVEVSYADLNQLERLLADVIADVHEVRLELVHRLDRREAAEDKTETGPRAVK